MTGEQKGTSYKVLRYEGEEDGGSWVEQPGFWNASSARSAIRKAAGESQGKYWAVPKRSFQPVTVTVERTVKVTIE